MDLNNLEERAIVAAKVLSVADMLLHDNQYTKEEAAKELVKMLRENNYLPRLTIKLLDEESQEESVLYG